MRSAGFSLAVAAGLCAAAFAIAGGQVVSRSGPVLALVVLVATGLFGRVAYSGRLPHPFSGLTTVLFMTAFAMWVSLSIGWSILPGDSYVDAGRVLAYVALFASFALLAQLLRERHAELMRGLLIAALVVCGYALLTRIVPGWFSDGDTYARLRAPFEYWNAVGVVAACGLLGALWLGTTRGVSRTWVAAAYPAGVLLLTALMLSQSRGSLVAAGAGIACWLMVAPRRLRSCAWLGAVGAIGAIVCAWAFSQDALANDHVAQSLRESTGWKFGLVLAIALALAYLAGLGVERWRAGSALPAPARRNAGKILLIALAFSPFLLLAGLATTDRGTWGTISDATSDLTDSSKVAPGNTPGRLTETSSLRARYWHDAFEVWGDHKLKGTGADTFTAARLPYREDVLKVRHAHGFVPQTLADLGIVGLGLAIALLICWLIAAGRALQVTRGSPVGWLDGADDNRNALAALAITVVVFGVHSAIDWTWYVPGAAFFGLIAAGWVAGSARNAERAGQTAPAESMQPRWQRAAIAAGIVLIGLSIVLSIYRPARAAVKVDDGYRLASLGHPYRALEAGRDAQDLDELSDDPYYLIANAQNNLGRKRQAELTLESISAIQPANPETWLHLAGYRLHSLSDPQGALDALKPLLYLSPNSSRGTALFAEAQTRLAQQRYEAELRKIRAKIRALAHKARKAAAAAGAPAP